MPEIEIPAHWKTGVHHIAITTLCSSTPLSLPTTCTRCHLALYLTLLYMFLIKEYACAQVPYVPVATHYGSGRALTLYRVG